MIFVDSRYAMTIMVSEDDGKRYWESRIPVSYEDVDGVAIHVVSAGDTLWSLAAMYYGGEDGDTNLWWAIADFQPEPIYDPTIQLQEGEIILIPPQSLIQNIIGERPDETITALD